VRASPEISADASRGADSRKRALANSVVTPRFWDKAASLAEETLGTLSPGSRRRLSEIASTRKTDRVGDERRKAKGESLPGAATTDSARERREKRRRGGALTVPDLLVPSGISGVCGLVIPSPSEHAGSPRFVASPHLGDLPSAVPNDRDLRRSPRGGAVASARAERGDLLSAVGPGGKQPRAGGPAKKRRPPRLQIGSDNASAPLLDGDLGTPLLAVGAGGGHVVGDVPGLRGPPGRGSAGMTLRKAVLERWGGIPTPREQDMALTPNDMNIALSPTQFLSTPR